MKKSTIILIVLGLIALPFIGLGIKMVFFPVNTAIKSVETAYEVVNQTMTGENAIRNYEWFKRQIQSIQALQSKEERAIEETERFKSDLPQSRSEWGREDKAEYDRLNSIAVGLGNQIDDAIAEYNARSEMVNRAIFKDELPTNISRSIVDGFQLTK